MAKNEIRYDVKVDSSDAQRGLRSFSQSATKAGKDAAKALDDTATAGDRARAAIETMAEAMDSEIRDAAAAADALKTALGDAADRFDVDQVVADLSRMGVKFDDIRGEADQFAATLKQVDNIRMQQTADGLDNVRGRLDGVRDSGDQSRSVLANMAGNAAQDLGELGGVVGTLGVGIGQLAEYAVDGNIALSNLAKVAGPLAALSLGLAAVNKFASEQARIKTWRTDQIESYTNAIEELGPGLEAIQQHLRDTADAAFEAESGITEFLVGGDKLPDVAAAAGVMGINFEEMSKAIQAGASDTDQGRRALEELREEVRRNGIEGADLTTIFEYVTEQQDAYAVSTANAAAQGRFFKQSAEGMNAAMAANALELQNQNKWWQIVMDDLADGKIDTQSAEYAWNQLADQGFDVAAEAAKRLEENLAASKEAANEQAAAVAEAQENLAEYARTVSSTDYGRAALEGATTAFSEFFSRDAGNAIRDQQQAFDDLAAAVAEYGSTNIDLGSPEGRAVWDALEQLGASVVPDLAKAYDDADGSLEQFGRNMQSVRQRVVENLTASFIENGDSADDAADKANNLADQIGLIPDNAETLYNLAGTEEAQLKLSLLQTSINNLPKNVQTQITQRILLGDYQGALAIVQNYYNTHGATVPVDADFTQAMQALRDFQNAVRGAQILAQVAATFPRVNGTAAPASATSAGLAMSRTVGPATTATVPVMMTAPTASVTINTAVIGSKHAVQRAVASSLRSWSRLNGRRPAA